MINAATVTLIFSATVYFLWSPANLIGREGESTRKKQRGAKWNRIEDALVTKKLWMKICPVPKIELNCCSTATPCLAYFLKSRVADHVYKKKECRQIEIVDRTKTWFTRIETIIVNLICCCLLFTKLLKRHPIHFWYVCKCFMAALVSEMKRLLWRFRALILPIKGWDCIFFYFPDEKSPARVAKVSAVAGSRLLFWTL